MISYAAILNNFFRKKIDSMEEKKMYKHCENYY